MYKKLRNLEITGFFITSVLAVVFHFLYEWFPSSIIAIFAPVNESIWEHIKIIFFPYLIYSIVEFIIYKPEDKYLFLCAKSYALSLLPIMLIIFNYTYTGIIGKNISFIDIGSTFIYLCLAFLVSYKCYKKRYCKSSGFSEIISLFFFISLIVFTFAPPHLPIFFDNTTAVYGIA